MIEVDGLTKRFYDPGEVVAVDGVSFRCAPGEVFGLLGPNGAGKTTALRMLATLLAPDAGTARLDGRDVREDPEGVRRAIGYLSSNTGLYGRLTCREMIHYFARLQGVPDPDRRTAELIDRFDLDAYATRRCDKLSTGNKQKVSIARAIVHDPPILIFDEPTSGLDVIVAQTVLEFIEDVRASGRCVLYSTHIMSEAERLCDRIGILHRGRLLAIGSLDELREATGERYLESIFLHFVRQEGQET